MAVARYLLVWHFYCNPVIYQAILTILWIIIILPNFQIIVVRQKILMMNRFFTSLRFVLNDSQLCVLAGVGWGWLAASLPTNPNQLLKLEIACHSEQSEESQIFYRTTVI